MTPSWALPITLVLYSASSVFFIYAFTKAPAWMRVAAWMTLILAFVAHGVDISLRGIAGIHPGTSLQEALSFMAWLLTGGYLLYSLKVRMPMLGAFIAPMAMVILALARLSPEGDAVEGLTLLGRIHISLAMVGVAVFTIATGLAIFYLLEERNLKNKRFDGLLYRRGIALETLDIWAHRLVLIGFPLFTVAIMLGAAWAAQRPDSFRRPEYPIALITWASFALLIVGRTAWGFRGRRAALVTLVGFVAALVVLAIYFFRRVGG
jgi:ABC-type uncharacterized transport system permease subunit